VVQSVSLNKIIAQSLVKLILEKFGHTKDFYISIFEVREVSVCRMGTKMSERRTEVDEEISFIAQVRSGGGTGSSGLITIPKNIKTLLGIEVGDFVKVTLKLVRSHRGES